MSENNQIENYEDIYENAIDPRPSSADRPKPDKKGAVSEKSCKLLLITVVVIFVLQLAVMALTGYLFLMNSELQAQSLLNKKEIEPLKTANKAINATIHGQQSDIKSLNEKVESLKKENKKLKEKEMNFNATTEFQAEQIKNMSEMLMRFSEKIAAIPDYGSCREIAINRSDVFSVMRNGKRHQVYCDMKTDGGGWTVFQRRLDGSVDFYRTWEEYAQGFGASNGEFWLGLEMIYELTQDGDYELRVDITDWEGNSTFAKYGDFSITGRSGNYRLTVGQYSGTAGDSLGWHNKRQFWAKDKDDAFSCAKKLKGAWWYWNCAYSSLNGVYNDTSAAEHGVFWDKWKPTRQYSMKTSEMKFRKK